MDESLVYLDYAAATPLDDAVLAAMQPFWQAQFYNPSASYQQAREVKQALEAARASVAHWLGARPSEIVFTAGGTEADNLAIQGVMRQFPEANVVISAIEHDAIRGAASQYNYREASVDASGRINLADLASKIDDNTVLVSILYASNEVGTIQPLREIAKILAEKRSERSAQPSTLSPQPLYFHTDASQAANYLDLHTARLGVDLLTLNGGKLYAPKQSGALYVKSGLALAPSVRGGGQERNVRSGTENVAFAVGLAKALELAQTTRRHEVARLQQLKNYFTSQVNEKLPSTQLNGSRKTALPNFIHLTMPNADNERLLLELEQRGILASAGSACSAASKQEASHVLAAMGLDDAAIRGSIRLTMGRGSTQAQIDATVSALSSLRTCS
jgi:cysteine desulfurase